ncbi:MAG: ATP-binding protein [Cellvibrio sp.]|uniref:ATP-binding protein n=1 Tax=Cellvibrio sp. TaxID=1965322 RepID=UPI0031A2D679
MSTKYLKHPNPVYRNNPLIEALGLPLLKDDLVAKCTRKYSTELELDGIPPEYHGFYRRTAIDNLIRFHEPRDELYKIYDIQRRMIESGLVRRNPLIQPANKLGVPIMALLSAINKDLQESKNKTTARAPANKQIKSFNVKKLGFAEVDHSYVFAGLSGVGKSSLMEAMIQAEEQVIYHTSYTDSNGTKHPFQMKQIQKLYLKVDNRKGQKSTLLSILESIDALVDEEYTTSLKGSDIRELIAAVRKAVVIHGVGLIIFDEAQNLAPSSKNEIIGASERVSMKFLEEIFNHISVPTFFVGTFSLLNLFTREMTIARRSAKDGCTLLSSCAIESPFWDRLCRTLFQARLLKTQRTEYEIIKNHLHHLSAGLPAVAVSLTRATLNFLSFLAPKNQDFSVAALNKIYREQFEILHKPLEALKNGNYIGYEDFEPMHLLQSVESAIKSQFSQSAKVSEIDNLLTGNPVIKKPAVATEIEDAISKDLDALAQGMSPSALVGDFQSNTVR